MDLNVIKTPDGEPFIPGSSLKGKLRSMLARTEGSEAVNIRELDKDSAGKSLGKADEHFNYLNQIFGLSGDDTQGKSRGEITRLIVRDAPLDKKHFDHTDQFGDVKGDMDYDYTTVKWENTIDRRKGTAEHPRQLERVRQEPTLISSWCTIYTTTPMQPTNTRKANALIPGNSGKTCMGAARRHATIARRLSRWSRLAWLRQNPFPGSDGRAKSIHS